MREELIEVVKHQFPKADKSALVIGDLMLDRYLIGEVDRISPEAPVPVVLLKQQNERAGGAANVAANLALLGINTTMAGVIGNDAEGRALLQMLEALHINSDAVMSSDQRPTVTKTRILGGHQQMMRLDMESRSAFTQSETETLLKQIDTALAKKPSVVILSDYAKGVLSETLCRQVIELAKSLGIPVLVDPKGRDYSKYRGATALTPNKKETAEACGVAIADHENLLKQAAKLRDALGLEFLAVTRGEEGISLLEQTGTIHIPAAAKQVFDVSGAGDTVIATLAAGLIHGLSHYQAFELANIAAGIVVGKVGTVPITRKALSNKQIKSAISTL
jgi:D-beta-D-heptose 7-phosphate kinase / D-beta-D-heptose 1-phosphate adenosyltransferase